MPPQPHNPFDTPRPRGTRMLQGTLRVAVAMQCLGIAAARLHLGETAACVPLLEQAYGLAPAEIGLLQSGVAWGCLVIGLVTLCRPSWVFLFPLCCWEFLNAASGTLYGEGLLAQGAWALQAPQYVVPLALLLIDLWPPALKTTLIMARMAVMFSLIAGIVALGAHGWITLQQLDGEGEVFRIVQKLARDVVRYPLSTQHLRQITLAVGLAEIAAAACLLCGRVKLVAGGSVLWWMTYSIGLAVTGGMTGYAQALQLAANWGGMLMVLQFWLFAIHERGFEYLPESGED